MSVQSAALKFTISMVTLTLMGTPAMAGEEHQSVADETMDTLVTTDWLSEHLEDPDLIVLDCTVHVEMDDEGNLQSSSGRADYDQGHIPSAGFADLKLVLSDPESPLDFALPDPQDFCAAMGALGVGDDSHVVLYDGMRSVWAARVWWMLRWVGFDRVALLDGGLQAWVSEERPLSTEPVERPARQLTPAMRPGVIADRDDVFAALDDDSVILIDAMPAPHFRGEMKLYDRPGHIPGAINISSMTLMDDTGHFRSLDELAGVFEGDRKKRFITYCGGGISASADAFVMTRLGFSDVAVYTASLQEWAADPSNPLVVEEP
jgi:thiosulfate/3-mercaptopyruvate sulfurtransferase